MMSVRAYLAPRFVSLSFEFIPPSVHALLFPSVSPRDTDDCWHRFKLSAFCELKLVEYS